MKQDDIKETLEIIKANDKHPLYHKFLIFPKTYSKLNKFLTELYRTQKKNSAKIELVKRIKELKDHNKWLSTYAELRILYVLCCLKKINAEFVKEEKDKSTPDIKLSIDQKEIFIEVKRLEEDGILEETNKTFELESIPSGKAVSIHYKTNKASNYNEKVDLIQSAKKEIKKLLLQKKYENIETETYKVVFINGKTRGDKKRTIIAVGPDVAWINENYLFTKVKRDLLEKIKQIKSRELVILFYYCDDWRYDEESFKRALFGNITQSLTPQVLDKDHFPEIYKNFHKVIEMNPNLIPSRSYPEKDGLFWMSEAKSLSAVGVITYWGSKDNLYKIFPNPFSEKSDLILDLLKDGKL